MAEQSGEDIFSFKAKADVFLEFEKIQVATGELNTHLISCLRCKSKILKPREGTLVEKEVRRGCKLQRPRDCAHCVYGIPHVAGSENAITKLCCYVS